MGHCSKSPVESALDFADPRHLHAQAKRHTMDLQHAPALPSIYYMS